MSKKQAIPYRKSLKNAEIFLKAANY